MFHFHTHDTSCSPFKDFANGNETRRSLDVNSKDDYKEKLEVELKELIGCTPLFIAAQKGHLSVVERLIAAGADVDKARTNDGCTPLTHSRTHSHCSHMDR